MTTAAAEPRPAEREQTTLALEGMTCASCAARIERTLNKLDGVEATVNYATETATVSFDPAVATPGRLVAAVEGIGYHAAPATGHDYEHDAAPTRLVVAAVLSVPLVLLAMIPPLQFGGWEWVAFALATPMRVGELLTHAVLEALGSRAPQDKRERMIASTHAGLNDGAFIVEIDGRIYEHCDDVAVVAGVATVRFFRRERRDAAA